MLEQIRRNRRLGTVVLWLCVVLWLIALLAGVRVRAQPAPAMAVPLHATADADHVGHVDHAAHRDASPTSASAHAVDHGAHAAPAPDAVPAPEPAHAHDAHHGPDCLLCIALSPPAAVAVVVYRPPVPHQGLDWRSPAQQPPALLAAAPLPARGPPAALHA